MCINISYSHDTAATTIKHTNNGCCANQMWVMHQRGEGTQSNRMPRQPQAAWRRGKKGRNQAASDAPAAGRMNE